MVESLLEAKADTTATTSKGFQPLHYACASNHPAALKALLTRGADPAAATKMGGVTPLHVACFLGLAECGCWRRLTPTASSSGILTTAVSPRCTTRRYAPTRCR